MNVEWMFTYASPKTACGALNGVEFFSEKNYCRRHDPTWQSLIFTIWNKELMKCHRMDVRASDELAKKKDAGDIQSTIRKVQGCTSSKMMIESKFSLLNTAVTDGH
eukprot:CAMPEP_0202497286 /NCGR_PEP_ID=MMETSP1361-20130828/22534_1 /ASSEMBLY_ACC=CAM_ASM_000849 /TAXON_ID=210615 /ORGANISM="Staurosira complex sp., Strain CCMP2646" /LENGTH=105 /DNA_ID=CAMNT_0049128853 /DNA_START=313 /DNA_END=627 /DNA_ORIENTATION=+